VALTRALENVDENHNTRITFYTQTGFESRFTLRLAVRIDMLLFRRFCLQSLAFAYCSG